MYRHTYICVYVYICQHIIMGIMIASYYTSSIVPSVARRLQASLDGASFSLLFGAGERGGPTVNAWTGGA